MKDVQKFTQACLVLPDGRFILQRRTKDAPHAAGLLGFFGGWVESNETPDSCVIREIKEETSLDVLVQNIKFYKDYILPGTKDYHGKRHFYLYKIPVITAEFEVYEGDGAEIYTLDELKSREDLISSTYHAVHFVL
jgi:8-oxo-dGTP pyrophosphatase MutT (NUDIX family)